MDPPEPGQIVMSQPTSTIGSAPINTAELEEEERRRREQANAGPIFVDPIYIPTSGPTFVGPIGPVGPSDYCCCVPSDAWCIGDLCESFARCFAAIGHLCQCDCACGDCACSGDCCWADCICTDCSGDCSGCDCGDCSGCDCSGCDLSGCDAGGCDFGSC